MEKTKKIIIGIGAAYCLYAFVLVASLVGAVVYIAITSQLYQHVFDPIKLKNFE